MKRKIVTALSVVITLVVVLFVLFYTGILNIRDYDGITVYTYQTDDGKVYTEATWDWKPQESRKVMKYVDAPASEMRTITLALGGNTYYKVSIPLVPIISDLGSTVYAVDGSFMIRVIKNSNLDSLSLTAGIDDGVAINQTTICSPETKKGKKTIATLMGDTAIIADVYSGDDTWSIIKKSISNAQEPYEETQVNYADGYSRLSKISYTGKFAARVIFQEVTLEQKKYLFEDGALYLQSVVKPLSEVKTEYAVRLCQMSGSSIDSVYDKDGMYYAKAGDYYLGLLAYNSNTTIVLIGYGEECKCNIINSMNYLK